MKKYAFTSKFLCRKQYSAVWNKDLVVSSREFKNIVAKIGGYGVLAVASYRVFISITELSQIQSIR